MIKTRVFFLSALLIGSTGAGRALWGQTAGFVYVASCGSNFCTNAPSQGIYAFAIDGTGGSLTPVPGSPF